MLFLCEVYYALVYYKLVCKYISCIKFKPADNLMTDFNKLRQLIDVEEEVRTLLRCPTLNLSILVVK